MRVENVKVYDLEESIIASGYPMKTEIVYGKRMDDKDLKRAETLCLLSKKENAAHGQFLSGIRVSFDLTFTVKAWTEAERYRFLDFVSSQSAMHRITQFDLDKSYNSYVDRRVVNIMKEKVESYNTLKKYYEDELTVASDETKEEFKNMLKEKYLEILYTSPTGLELTARMSTNYRCLRNIYVQRKDHRLPEWRDFCKWIETLPLAYPLICDKRIEKNVITQSN